MDDIRITLSHPDLMPLRKHVGDAGADLKAAEDCIIPPGEGRNIPTGVGSRFVQHVVSSFPPQRLAVQTVPPLANCFGVIDCHTGARSAFPCTTTARSPLLSSRATDRAASWSRAWSFRNSMLSTACREAPEARAVSAARGLTVWPRKSFANFPGKRTAPFVQKLRQRA